MPAARARIDCIKLPPKKPFGLVKLRILTPKVRQDNCRYSGVRRTWPGGYMHSFSIETTKLTPAQTRFHMLKMEDTFREQVLAMASTLVSLVDLRDCYTGGHSTRVADYSHRIAIELGMNDEDTETLLLAASLHDVGKIGRSE